MKNSSKIEYILPELVPELEPEPNEITHKKIVLTSSKVEVCECGATKCGHPIHSTWCPKRR